MASKLPQAEWDWLTFLSNWHEREYERRYTLENVVATPISLLTGVCAIFFLLVTQYDYKDSGRVCLSFFALALVAALLFAGRSIFWVFKSYAIVKNGVYKGVPEATALRKHMNELVAYYKEHDPTMDGVQKFKDYFIEVLADQITVNVANNDDRTKNIQLSKKPLMYAFAALFLSLPSFLFNQFTKPDPVHKVSIVSQPSATTSKPLAPPPPPVRPAERQILDLPPPTQPKPGK